MPSRRVVRPPATHFISLHPNPPSLSPPSSVPPRQRGVVCHRFPLLLALQASLRSKGAHLSPDHRPNHQEISGRHPGPQGRRPLAPEHCQGPGGARGDGRPASQGGRPRWPHQRPLTAPVAGPGAGADPEAGHQACREEGLPDPARHQRRHKACEMPTSTLTFVTTPLPPCSVLVLLQRSCRTLQILPRCSPAEPSAQKYAAMKRGGCLQATAPAHPSRACSCRAVLMGGVCGGAGPHDAAAGAPGGGQDDAAPGARRKAQARRAAQGVWERHVQRPHAGRVLPRAHG